MVIIIMGVSGCGKTTVGRQLADELQLSFYDADDFHSATNVEKMRAGTPLTDEDRSGWLAALAAGIATWESAGGAVLACSALKETYRATLQAGARGPLRWVFLDGEEALIAARLRARHGHYMSAVLLASQFATLEKPPYGLHLSIAAPPEALVTHILAHMNNDIATAEFGLIGLGVMGKSLALNLVEKGVRVALYNRHVPGKEEDVAQHIVAENASLGHLAGFDDLSAFIASLAPPRKIMLMVTAGAAVDAQLTALLPLLTPGDVLIDGGNSHYRDTSRRAQLLAEKGCYFVGTGVSGGEEGARRGPSIMPGGAREGYELVARYLELMATKDANGVPCTAYLGPDGAGHFVKMVHNGIEYAEMQLLAEVYQLLRDQHVPPMEMVTVLRAWQADPNLSSYLLGITVDILQVKEGDGLLLDYILDQAEQKGTGGWSVQAALEYGVPFGIITEAVLARVLSAHKGARVQAAARYPTPATPELQHLDKQVFISQIKSAYQAARLLNHASGFQLLQAASTAESWALNLGEIARLWTSGCIIRSGLMEQLSRLFHTADDLLSAPVVVTQLQACRADFAVVVALGLQRGVALPVLSAALNYFLGYTTANSPANLIQAQRDYFGAHTFRRTDRPTSEVFHAEWTA